MAESNRKIGVMCDRFFTEFNWYTVKRPGHRDTSINHTVLSLLPCVIVAVSLLQLPPPYFLCFSTFFLFRLHMHTHCFSLSFTLTCNILLLRTICLCAMLYLSASCSCHVLAEAIICLEPGASSALLFICPSCFLNANCCKPCFTASHWPDTPFCFIAASKCNILPKVFGYLPSYTWVTSCF